MIFKDFYPTLQLKEFVEVYHLRHFIVPATVDKIPFKPYPPRPEQCIAFYPRGSETSELIPGNAKVTKPRSVISGQFTNRINRYTTSEFMIILVVFKPGALHRMTSIPFYELTNTHVDLESVFPQESREVNERLNSCDDYTEMINIIETFLVCLFAKIKIESRQADEVFNIILTKPDKYSLDWLANQACLSPRQFERKFYDYIGVTPKMFLRITRFHLTYNMRLKYPDEDWLSIAVACGYHDYQHLVRDYKEFANTTPNLLFAEEYKAPERILGLNS